MPRTKRSPAQARLGVLIGLTLGATVAVVGGLLLRQHAPGNMGNGFLIGALLALAAYSLATWRSLTRPDQATTFERAFTQAGDERDDAVLTRTFAVLGAVTLPLTGIAAIAIALGAYDAMVLTLLLVGQIAVGVVTAVTVNRRN